MPTIVNAIEESSFNFFPLMIVLILAFIVPITLSRIKQVPIVVGEILIGVVVGTSGLGWVQEDTILTLFSDIGLAFLMFLAGMEIDFELLFKDREEGDESPNMLLYSSGAYFITLLLAGIGAFILRNLGLEANLWLLTFILSATSLGVLLPVLKERGLTRTPFGQVVFIVATLADFVTVILLTVYLIVQQRGLDLEIFSISLLFLGFFLAYRLGLSFTSIPSVRRVVEELSRATVQLKVRGAIAILLTFVALAEFINVELILGAFLAGMVISLIKTPQDDSLVHNLEAFGFGFFIPVFFIMVGVNLELGALWESPQALLVLPIFLIISLIVKILPIVIFKRVLTWKEVLSGGVLLNTHLSVEIAVTIVGARSGLLSPAATTAITLFAILTVLIMPIIFGAIAPQSETSKRRHIAICGGGQEAIGIARELQGHGESVCILNEDWQTARQIRNAGFAAILTEPDKLNQVIDFEGLKGFVALCDDDQENLQMCRAAQAAGVQRVVARVNDPVMIPEFKKLGIQPYIPSIAQTVLLSLMVRNPDVYTLLTNVTDDRDIRQVSVRNTGFVGRKVRDVRLPGETLIMSIRRNGDFIIPHGNVELNLWDHLTLVGCPDELDEAYDILS